MWAQAQNHLVTTGAAELREAGGRAPTHTKTIDNRPQEHGNARATPITGAVNRDRRQRRLESINKNIVSVGGQEQT